MEFIALLIWRFWDTIKVIFLIVLGYYLFKSFFSEVFTCIVGWFS